MMNKMMNKITRQYEMEGGSSIGGDISFPKSEFEYWCLLVKQNNSKVNDELLKSIKAIIEVKDKVIQEMIFKHEEKVQTINSEWIDRKNVLHKEVEIKSQTVEDALEVIRLLLNKKKLIKKAVDSDEAWKIQETYAGKPHGWVQWKGTDVCMDVHCKCGYHSHVDAEFVYYIKCPKCQTVYMCNGHIELIELEKEPENCVIMGQGEDEKLYDNKAKQETD